MIIASVCMCVFMAGCKTEIDFPRGEYPNGELLVAADFLETIMDQSGVVIIDARSAGYETGHIPGAISLKWNDYVDENSKLLPVADLQTKLSAAGINRNMTFIIYDDTLKSWGAAGRVFWMLEYLGCSDVHILNGGWDLWSAQGRDTETSANTLSPNIFIASVRDSVITTKDYISSRLGDSDFVIIDSRTNEEYNGWQFYGEARGGHIPGAVQIPYEWFYVSDNNTVLNYADLNWLFESHGVTTDKEVTSYCTAGIRSGFVYFALRLLGYQNCSNYANSFKEWASDSSLAMEKLPHYEKLVSAAWVKDLIDGKNPATYTGNKFLIVEARYVSSVSMPDSAEAALVTNYIPGAISIHPCYMEHGNDTSKYYPNYTHPSDGNLLPADELQQAIADLGITKDTTVVVYGTGIGIPMSSCRVAWALMYAGVEDVRVLDGGYPAWLSMGGATVADPATPAPVDDFGATVPVHPEYNATTDYVKAISEGTNTESVLVDERLLAEYIGEDVNHYTCFETHGHIPGAVWFGNWTEFADPVTTYSFRSYTEVQEHLDSLGVTIDKEPVFYCGTGWRSSLGFFTAYLLGYPKMRNYDGSYYEWSWGGVNPISADAP